MVVDSEVLGKIANAILAKLKSSSVLESERIFKTVDYHGFLKSRIPVDFLEEILSPFRLTTEDMQIEIVKVETDLSKEVHYHANSFAYVVCLGSEYRAEDPRGAKAFLSDTWFSICTGDVVKIPPRTPHGFTVENGGVLVFLSVQSPPIEQGGVDDYHKVS